MVEKFSGKLIKLDRTKVVKIDANDKFDNFFLILGLIYNDFKSLIFYVALLKEHFGDKIDEKKPEVNVNFGEYSGMKTHLNKLMISTIYEFLMFLKNKSKVIESSEFKILSDKLFYKDKDWLQQIIDIANRNIESKTNFKKDSLSEMLYKIKNGGSFHHHSCDNNLRLGYINHFYTRYKQDAGTEFAYYSEGNCMKDVRYFYCDAAFQGFTYTCGEYKDNIEKLKELGQKMNNVLSALMKLYIKDKEV